MKKQYIHLSDGPEDYRVYQRNENDSADFDLDGHLSGEPDGTLVCDIVAKGKPGEKSVQTAAFACRKGAFSGTVYKIPVGFYDIRIRFIDNGGEAAVLRTIKNIAVGDLYLLSGQSNMDGSGMMAGAEPPSGAVHAFYLDDRWGIAKDPFCYFNEAVDPIHWIASPELRERWIASPKLRKCAIKETRDFCFAGAGCGVRFGKEMYKYNHVPVGLIVCSHGATSMKNWDPSTAGLGGMSLYGSLIRRVKMLGGKVKAVLWYQGESDAKFIEAPEYRKRFIDFIKALRSDFGQPDLPVLFAQLSRYYGDMCGGEFVLPKWNYIQNEQRMVEKECHDTAFVSTILYTLNDIIHIDTPSQRRLGTAFSLLARHLCFRDSSVENGPRPVDIRFEDRERKILCVAYEGANDGFKTVRRVWGFSAEKDGESFPLPFGKVDAQRPDRVLLRFRKSIPDGSTLWYGKGTNPACNLMDKAGLAAPVFGPEKITDRD